MPFITCKILSTFLLSFYIQRLKLIPVTSILYKAFQTKLTVDMGLAYVVCPSCVITAYGPVLLTTWPDGNKVLCTVTISLCCSGAVAKFVCAKLVSTDDSSPISGVYIDEERLVRPRRCIA